MKKYVLTALAFILIINANAQWISQNAGFTNDTLGFYEMSIVNRKTAWVSCYDGKTWFKQQQTCIGFYTHCRWRQYLDSRENGK